MSSAPTVLTIMGYGRYKQEVEVIGQPRRFSIHFRVVLTVRSWMSQEVNLHLGVTHCGGVGGVERYVVGDPLNGPIDCDMDQR